MPRANAIQTSFNKGEVSPLARGRVDVNLYAAGAETVENLMVRQQGALFRRSGTKFVRKSKLSSSGTRVIPFTVSDTTAYMLEFGDSYIHFYKNKEPLFETTTTEIEEWTTLNDGGLLQIVSGADYRDLPGWGDLSFNYGAGAGPADNGTATQSAGDAGKVRITTSVPHTLRTGAVVQANSGGADPNSINNTIKTVTRINAYAVDLDSTTFVSTIGVTDTAIWSHGLLAGDRVYFSTYTAGPTSPSISDTFQTVKSLLAASATHFTLANVAYSAGVPVGEEGHVIPIEIVTTYTSAQLSEITYAQSADVLYLFHPDHPVRKLVRLDTDGDRNDWLLADVDFKDGPYLPFNDLSPNIDTTTPANGAKYSDVYFEVTSYAHTATAKVTAGAAFANADDALYIEYKQGDQWKLAQLPNLAGGETTATVTIVDNILLQLDEATKLRTTPARTPFTPGSTVNSTRANVTGLNTAGQNVARYQQRVDTHDELASDQAQAAQTIGAGVITSQFSNTFSKSDVGKYLRVRDSGRTARHYWVLITGINSASTTANKVTHSAALTYASNNHTGKFIISGETRTCTVTAYRNGTAFSAFASTDVGRHIRLGFSGRWTWGKISAYTSASVVTVTLYEDMPRDVNDASKIAGNQDSFNQATGAVSSNPTTGIASDWRMGSWSATTGYPSVGCFHEQRLFFGATATQPATLWASVSGDFEVMSDTELDSTVLDDSGFARTLASTKANAIKWMLSGPALTVGTSGGEWQVRASTSINEPITPTNVRATEYTSHGSGSVNVPARIGTSVVFADRSGEKVHELFYSFDKDAVESDDLTAISEHILRAHEGALRTAYQSKPHSIFWVLCNDGTLAGMTFNKKQEVIGWHHHTIQGGTVEDIAVIPAASGGDQLWMVVNRTISAATVRYIEVLEDDFYPASSSSLLGMKFLDSHMFIEGFTGTAITGLNHLEGQSVVVVKDGTRVTGTFTVASGAITLSAGATSELCIGMLGNADVKSLPPEGGSQFGTSQGQTKRVVSVDGRFYNMVASGLQEGPSFDELTPITFAPISPAVFFTGTERLKGAHGYDKEAVWCIRQSEPYPLSLLFCVTKLETNE